MKLVGVKQDGKQIAVNVEQIEWIQAAEHGARIHFASGADIVVDEAMADVSEKLNRQS
jgi:DNA-binding LytR/AlgR family response regulator